MGNVAETRAKGNFELITWFFMRISGLVLVFLVLGHWAVMHIINDITDVNYAFVAARWTSPFWRTYDIIMLFLALLHGTNGMRTIIDDYARHRGWRVFWLSLLYVSAAVLLVMGTLVLVTFQPEIAG